MNTQTLPHSGKCRKGISLLFLDWLVQDLCCCFSLNSIICLQESSELLICVWSHMLMLLQKADTEHLHM